MAYYYKIRRVPGDNGKAFCFSHLIAAVAPTRRQRITTVPNIRNRSQVAAAIALGKSKLTVGTVGKLNSDRFAAGNVIDQDPPPRSVAPQDYEVDFNVSLGADTPANSPPTITSTPVTLATEGLLYSYEVDGEDQNTGDTLTYSLKKSPTGMNIDPATGLVQWTPTSAQGGNHPVTVRVKDNGGLSDTQRFKVAVGIVNEAPKIKSSPITRATEEQRYSYDIDAKDPDTGDTLTYSLEAAPTGMNINPATGLIR